MNPEASRARQLRDRCGAKTVPGRDGAALAALNRHDWEEIGVAGFA